MAASSQIVETEATMAPSDTQLAAPVRPDSSRASAVTPKLDTMAQIEPYATSMSPRLLSRRITIRPPTRTYAPKAISVKIS